MEGKMKTKILAAHLLSGARETEVRIGMAYPRLAPVKQNKEKSQLSFWRANPMVSIFIFNSALKRKKLKNSPKKFEKKT